MWINTYTLMIGLNGSAVKRALRDGFGLRPLAVQMQIRYYLPTKCGPRNATANNAALVSS
jgi:hypothetical protein